MNALTIANFLFGGIQRGDIRPDALVEINYSGVTQTHVTEDRDRVIIDIDPAKEPDDDSD